MFTKISKIKNLLFAEKLKSKKTLAFLMAILAFIFILIFFMNKEDVPPIESPSFGEVKNDVIKELTVAPQIKMTWGSGFVDRNAKKDILNIKLKNNNSVDVENLEISFSGDGSNTLNKKSAFLKIDKLSAGEEKNIDQEIIFHFLNDDSQTNLKLDIKYQIKGETFKIKNESPFIKIVSRIEAKALLIYTSQEGDKLGLGPIPPKVGEPTNYWLFLESKSFGDFSDFVLQAKLGENVEFFNSYSLLSGEINYNEETKMINWHIKAMKNGEDKYRLGLELMLLPTENDLGKEAIILEDIKYYSLDQNSGQKIYGQLNDVTTNLSNNSSFGPEAGIVVTK